MRNRNLVALKALVLWLLVLGGGAVFVTILATSRTLQFLVFSDHPLMWAARVGLALLVLTTVPVEVSWGGMTTKGPLLNLPVIVRWLRQAPHVLLRFLMRNIALYKPMCRALTLLIAIDVIVAIGRILVLKALGPSAQPPLLVEAGTLTAYLSLLFIFGWLGAWYWPSTFVLPLREPDSVLRPIVLENVMLVPLVILCSLLTISCFPHPPLLSFGVLFMVFYWPLHLLMPWLVAPYERFDSRSKVTGSQPLFADELVGRVVSVMGEAQDGRDFT